MYQENSNTPAQKIMNGSLTMQQKSLQVLLALTLLIAPLLIVQACTSKSSSSNEAQNLAPTTAERRIDEEIKRQEREAAKLRKELNRNKNIDVEEAANKIRMRHENARFCYYGRLRALTMLEVVSGEDTPSALECEKATRPLFHIVTEFCDAKTWEERDRLQTYEWVEQRGKQHEACEPFEKQYKKLYKKVIIELKEKTNYREIRM